MNTKYRKVHKGFIAAVPKPWWQPQHDKWFPEWLPCTVSLYSPLEDSAKAGVAFGEAKG